MIYIASPYSHPDPAVREARYSAVFHYTARLSLTGVICFSPIVYGRQFEVAGFAGYSFQYWQDFNEHMLISAKELRILHLPGHETSLGIKHERELAARYNIHVREQPV